MNTRSDFLRKNFKHEKEIVALANKLGLQVEPFIINRHCLCVDLHMRKDFFLAVLLPRQQLVDECRDWVPKVGPYAKRVSSRGGKTAANVLSINVVAVWKNRDAYLFTGDAHLADVTQAAKDFLCIHRMRSFKYVDVPHHGSANSNVEKVDHQDRGLAGIPADNYLISHWGNHQNLSFQTVKDILKREDCRYLYFLYKERNSTPPVKNPPVEDCPVEDCPVEDCPVEDCPVEDCPAEDCPVEDSPAEDCPVEDCPVEDRPVSQPPDISCKECKVGHETTTRNWHCACVSEEDVEAKIRFPDDQECFVFFPFTD